ncbi:DUF1924 domain-containing protein [Azoarcus communis]|uniref:DUF1924 domain-containing protein n=1 Tax=Parazoarcus communis TaxID=41977 RepID=UPI0014595017|nr:DUF1924 domain-containing protein [Parazoarcus communis]NMG46910.1 DUF1924 domain-containing protein [Parazoarcus communis]
MKLRLALSCIALSSYSLLTSAGPLEQQLAAYATEAKTANPAFAGFSAARGEQLYITRFGLGKPDTPACTTCHGNDPRTSGETLTGKHIDPVALSVSPGRYADSAKVEKWFRRNCNEVLGRECTPLEKGDWLAFVGSR